MAARMALGRFPFLIVYPILYPILCIMLTVMYSTSILTEWSYDYKLPNTVRLVPLPRVLVLYKKVFLIG